MHRFYNPTITEGSRHLPEDESKHCAQILRMQPGDSIQVMDGNGGVFTCELTRVSKNRCEYEILQQLAKQGKGFRTHLFIAPTKNADRMEWLIEKLSELGVDQVTFLITQNSERRKLRLDRLEKKAINAIKQSGNPFLTKLSEATSLKEALASVDSEIKLIAHVDQSHRYIGDLVTSGKDAAICIGPEGDFTSEEIEWAKVNGFQPVSLGNNTLRTETAGFAACCLINFVNRH